MAEFARGIINAYQAGSEEQQVEKKRSALASYVPQALQGDKNAAAQVGAVDPELGARIMANLQDMDENKRTREKDNMEWVGGAVVGDDGNPLQDPAAYKHIQNLAAMRGIAPDRVAAITPENARMLMAGSQVARTLRRQAAQDAQSMRVSNANIHQSYAAAAASGRSGAASDAAAAAARSGIDPNTGRRKVSSGVENKDAGILKEYGAASDAAANIAAVFSQAIPSIQKGYTGPGSGIKRNIAGVVSLLPDFGIEQALTGRDHSVEVMNAYDSVNKAAKIGGIEGLKGIGGSDTERELLTAIETGVSNDIRPEENLTRVRSQAAAAEILSKKAQLATEWVNKFGSLTYAAPDGTTWQGFWPAYQKERWAEFQASERPPPPRANRPNKRSAIEEADSIVGRR